MMAKRKPKRKAAGYIRVSSDIQTKGYSLKDQRAAIEDYCKHNRLELVETYSDPGKSGADIQNRCGLKKLLMDAVVGYGGGSTPL